MNRQTILPSNEAAWLDLRRPDITSTMMSALFELSPYATVFELYHAKKNGLELPFKSNARMEKGKRMEGFAAQEIALAQGWDVSHKPEYIRLPDLRIGSSFDFNAICHQRGPGLLEIKAVDTFLHKERWSPDEIPSHIEVQARHQMMVANVSWVCVAAFTNIYDHHLYFLERDEEFESGMLNAATQFWQDVDNGVEPKPDFYRDAPVIAALYKTAGGDLEDRTEDIGFNAVVAKYMREKKAREYHESEESAAKAELHKMLATAGGAWGSDYKVKAGWTKGTQGTLVTPDMVGTYVGARTGYRQCIVNEINKQKRK